MTSTLVKDIGNAAYVGATMYVFCRAFSHHNALEKAVLVTVLVGLRNFAETAIKHQQDDKYQNRPLTRVLMASGILLAVPCALYAGRVFNFKEADYLQIVGLTSLGATITYGLTGLYQMITSNGSGERR